MLMLISDAFVASELADTIVTDLVTSSELDHHISSTASQYHSKSAMKRTRKIHPRSPQVRVRDDTEMPKRDKTLAHALIARRMLYTTIATSHSI